MFHQVVDLIQVLSIGMLGTIASIKENTVIMQTFDGSKIEILKAAITNVEKPQEEKEKPQEEKKK